MVFRWVNIVVFPLSLCYSYVLSGAYKVISDGRGEVCLAQRARDEPWRQNQFLATSATHLGRGLSDGGCTALQR